MAGEQTIGLLTTTDSGKSLLLDYVRKNYENSIYESTNRGPYGVQIYDSVQLVETWDYHTIRNLIKVHGCDALPFPDIKSRITKSDLKAIHYYAEPTKSKVFIFVRAEDYAHYCDWGIFVGRDVRARWCVTQHREEGWSTYMSAFYPHFMHYQYIADKTNIYELVFEEFITDPKSFFDKINHERRMTYDAEFVYSTPKYNDWLTDMDLKNLYLYAQDGDLINQADLDSISAQLVEYNTYFGYPQNITKEEILGPTIKADIATYMAANFDPIPDRIL
jgi:hypothetical protein